MDIAIKVLSIYDLALTIVGPVGNLLVFVVAIRLRQTTTFVFIAFLAVTDTLTLYFWNLNHFTMTFFGVDLESSLYSCKYGTFIQFFSLEASAWILVLISVDRFLCVAVKSWKNVYFKPFRASVSSCVVIVVLFVVNLNVIVTFGDRVTINGTTFDVCFSEHAKNLDWMNTWSLVHSAIYSYIPFILLLISNIMLSVFLSKAQSTSVATARKSVVAGTMMTPRSPAANVNRLVVTITLLFILMSCPGTISSIFYSTLVSSKLGQLTIILLDSLEFSYHGLSFIILMLTNRKFSVEFLNLVTRPKVAKVAETTPSKTSSHRGSKFQIQVVHSS